MKTITRTDYSILSSPEIKNRLAKQAPIQEETGNIPNAAVLIPLFLQNKRWNVLFIHRSSWVDKHKDQVSFPGGMAEEGDQDPFETALRETREEIGIASELIKVLGARSTCALAGTLQCRVRGSIAHLAPPVRKR